MSSRDTSTPGGSDEDIDLLDPTLVDDPPAQVPIKTPPPLPDQPPASTNGTNESNGANGSNDTNGTNGTAPPEPPKRPTARPATPAEPEPAPVPETQPEPEAGAEQATVPGIVHPVATTAPLGKLELRQIAGLTAGNTMDLDATRYNFAESDGEVGFSIEVDENERVMVLPGSADASIDTVPVTEPTPLGSGILDVGSGRFLIRPRRERKRATDWLDQHEIVDQPEPEIAVPGDLADPIIEEVEPTSRRRFPWPRPVASTVETLDVTTWEFIEKVRETRADVAERERYLHPDPAELAVRAKARAPILGIRPPGHTLFAKVGVMMADMPWIPKFDDINDIPESLGPQLKPLLSLPSVPIVADLTVGPLGIAGSRQAALACARHIIVSLYGVSTSDIHLHLAYADSERDAWEWASEITEEPPSADEKGFTVVIADGMDSFERTGIDQQDAIDAKAGMVVLADSVEALPSYCGSVLQVDLVGGGLLTNHHGHVITGTPIGITENFASEVADDLHRVMLKRGR